MLAAWVDTPLCSFSVIRRAMSALIKLSCTELGQHMFCAKAAARSGSTQVPQPKDKLEAPTHAGDDIRAGNSASVRLVSAGRQGRGAPGGRMWD